ncbi:MAG: serine O-acetyltransferase [Candidatus Omnitrophica bacterium]|nr:serine O-acetyltransferase [Candidatus Omnitrophota bacterium]
MVIATVFSDEIQSTRDKDPAAKNYLEVILLYPGLHAIISHRICHALWNMKIPFFPRAISQVTRFLTGIEIHPGAQIGKGLFIDHGMGVVIGETTIIGKDVTLFQGVTLGGTGKECGKRHPTLGDNVVVGTGAKVLGNINIGDNSYVGANAVILRDVPANSTVVGVPGHITKKDGKKIDVMDHVHVSDPVMQHMKDLMKRLKHLEDEKKHKD